MHWSRVAVAAGVGALAVLWLATTTLHGDPRAAAAATIGAASGQQAPGPAEAAPPVLARMHLLPDGAVRAIPGSVRIGLGQVSPDEASAGFADPAAAPEEAGAGRYEELAATDRWMSVPARLLADGRVEVGPLRLPPADRYVLQARGEDGLRFYAAAFTRDRVPAKVSPIVGAGIRTHVDVPGARILLRRVASSPPPPVWQELQAWAEPALLEAFSETPLPVTGGQVLGPLAPGPLDVVLEVGGVEAGRRRLSLPAGRIVDVRFDPTTQAVAQAVSVDLALEFVSATDGRPVAGLQVDWLSGPAQRRRTTDDRGRARFDHLDRHRVQEFSLQASPPRDGLPEWPELRALRIPPEDLAGTGAPRELVHHRVELAPLDWLIARLPPAAGRGRAAGRSPYPIQVLQRRRGGGWVDTPAAHFIETDEGVAVSISDPGTYRVVAALSPWQVLTSTLAQVGGHARPTVEFTSARGRDVVVTVMRDGEALAGAPVHVIGPLGNLPPAVLAADAHGRITLSSATIPVVRVEVPGSDQIAVRLDSSRVLADFGLQRSE